MGLTADDYENIWLRLKSKIIGWLIAVAAGISVVFGISIYSFINHQAKQEAISYMKSSEFQDNLHKEIKDSTAKSLNQIYKIQTLLHSLEHTALGLQVAISNKQIILTDKKGHTCFIEIGRAQTSSVIFPVSFQKLPIVVITANSNIASLSYHNRDGGIRLYQTTKYGFSIYSGSRRYLQPSYNWLAISCPYK